MTIDDCFTNTMLKQSKRLTQFFLLAAIGLYGTLRSCDKKPETKAEPNSKIQINYQTPALAEEQDFLYDSNGKKLKVIYSF